MRKAISVIFVLLGLLFICPTISQAQSVDLVGVLFKLQGMKDNATADIQRYEGEIQKCGIIIMKTKQIISLAQQKGNKKAGTIAQEALMNAKEAMRKNQELKNRAELRKKKADIAYTNVRNLLSKNAGSNSKIKGIVTNHTGNVYIYKANGTKASLENGFLEIGDGIWTGDGSAEIQILGGRATARIGPHSRFVMKEYTPQEKVAELIKGKVYIAVDKIDEYMKKMKKEIAQHKSDPTLKDKVVGKMMDEYEKILDRYKKVKSGEYDDRSAFGTGILGMTLMLRTPCAVAGVRGTKFLVFEDEKTGTELIVLRGIVDVKAIKGNESVSVDAGYRIRVTKDGIISKPEKIDLKKLKRWWKR